MNYMNYRTRLEVYLEQRNVLGYLNYSNAYSEKLTPKQRRRISKKLNKELKNITCSEGSK